MKKIYDLNQGNLSAAVVKALDQAMFPKIFGCSMKWNGEPPKNLDAVFYNDIISSYRILNANDFGTDSTFTFTCGKNSITKQTFVHTFNPSHFNEVPIDTGLFKMAARSLIVQN